MNFSDNELETIRRSVNYVTDNSDLLINKYILTKRPLHIGFVIIFMAGSPGAGKTEFSIRWIENAYNKNITLKKNLEKRMDISTFDNIVVRIDVDEVREFFPEYQKTDVKNGIHGNAHVIQKAANKGLDILRKYCLENEISFLHDGTFGNFSTMKKIIKRSLANDRKVVIFYLYIDPLSAWEFTKAREKMEGRNIVKGKFIQQYFDSKLNVDRIKKEFGNKIEINCVLKDGNNKVIDLEFNVSNVDTFLEKHFKKGTISKYSKEDLIKKLH